MAGQKRFSECGAGLDFVQGGFQGVLSELLVVVVLEVEPDVGGPAEVTLEAQRGIDGDGAFAFDDLVDAARGDADVLGEPVFGESEGQEEILAQDFAGVDGRMCFHGFNGSR